MKKLRLLILALCVTLTAGATDHQKTAAMSDAAAKPDADSLLRLGRKFVRTNPDTAIIVFNDAIQLTDSNSLTRAAIYRQMSNAYSFKEDFLQAVDINTRAISIRNQNSMDSANMAEMAVLYYNNAINYQNSGNYLAAIRSVEQAFPLFEKTENDYFLSIAYDLAATLCQKVGSTYLAQRYALNELALCEKMGDTIGISYTYDLLAAICETTGQFSQQLIWQKKSLELRIMMDDIVRVAQSYNNIGNTYISYAQGILINSSSGINANPKGYNENQKKANQKSDTALMYLKEALRLKMGFNEAQARQTEFTVSETFETKKYWRQNLLVGTLNNIALAYNGINADSCAFYGWKAAEYYKLLHDDYGYVSALITICEGGGKKGLRGRSQKDMIEEIIRISDKNANASFVHLKQMAYTKLAIIYYDNGDYKNAYLSYRESFRLKDSLSNESSIRELALMESRYEFDKQHTTDSINHYHETLRLEAEHQNELLRNKVQTRVMLSVALLLILIGVIMFFFYKTTKENEENKLRNKALETERSLLRTQMNPHFIFNALNSVQSFIVGNNAQDAVRFLSKFAKLMRMILNNSMVQSVTLSNEMQSLGLYLDLERARFGNKFNYKIDIDDNVEEDLVCVPPMLVQPFIENAIIHGLMHKTTDDGLITIKISENDENSLICQVTDNGVGRKAAAELEKNNERKHKSVGMQLTRDRLRDLNSEANAQMSCTITDLEDEVGNALGTQVTIIIPIVGESNEA